MIRAASAIAVLVAGCRSVAPCPPTAPTPAAPATAPLASAKGDRDAADRAFAALEALAGSWTATTGGATSPSSFERIAGGTAVMQRSVFVAVFHRDGDQIGLVVFPDDGYVARFRTAAIVDGKPLELALIDTINLSADAPRPTAVSIEAHGADELVEHWTWTDHGAVHPVDVVLHRVTAAGAGSAPR